MQPLRLCLISLVLVIACPVLSSITGCHECAPNTHYTDATKAQTTAFNRHRG